MSLIFRRVATLVKQPLAGSASLTPRFMSDKVSSDKAPTEPIVDRIPDDIEQAVGLERKELEELMKGNKDPWGLEGLKWGHKGTKENPRLVPSHFESRVVGCACDPESELIRYFELKKGELTACPCNRYFKLVDAEGDISW